MRFQAGRGGGCRLGVRVMVQVLGCGFKVWVPRFCYGWESWADPLGVRVGVFRVHLGSLRSTWAVSRALFGPSGWSKEQGIQRAGCLPCSLDHPEGPKSGPRWPPGTQKSRAWWSGSGLKVEGRVLRVRKGLWGAGWGLWSERCGFGVWGAGF